ncbi:hypothetical protein [uncultured Robinsoniella sp.]|uniref:hypothetical protein n=1 Tax=uncultured Robinsoniella sp. TaxID=904190 RepID=UPI00374EB518
MELMDMDRDISIIRELSRQVKEIAQMPVYQEKKKKWANHNDLTGDMEPLLWICPDDDGGWLELVEEKDLLSVDPDYRCLEWQLRKMIYHHENFQDDYVIEPVVRFDIPGEYTGYVYGSQTQKSAWGIKIEPMGISAGAYRMNNYLNNDENLNRLLGHEVDFIIDLHKLDELKEKYKEAISGILDIEFHVPYSVLVQSLLIELVHLRGLTELMIDLYDEPEMLHKILDHMSSSKVKLLERLEEKGLTFDNCSNIYTGSGGLGYTNHSVKDKAQVKLHEMWGFADSQEFSSVSPEMFREFALQYQSRGLKKFGYACYGCCEPLDMKYDAIFTELPNIRRLSVSPWSNINIAADAIGKKAIYSRKPDPAQICGGFDAWEMEKQLSELRSVTAGKCYTEIILKDIRTIHHNPQTLISYVDLVNKIMK